jgi:hypothetical protein
MRLFKPSPRHACGGELLTSAAKPNVNALRLSYPLVAFIEIASGNS